MKNKLFKYEDLDKLSINEVRDLYEKYINPQQSKAINTFGFGQEIAEKSLEQWIYTSSGKKILDFTGGYGVLNHGHNHPKIIKRRIDFQKNNRMEVHKNFLSQYTAALSSNIANLLPGDLNKVYLPNSGAEANEGAIKLAFKYHNNKRKTLLHSDISFHGKLLGTGSITASPEADYKFPGLTNIDKFEYNNIESVEEKLKKYQDDVYAIIIEPFSASSLRSLSNDFIKKIRSICDRQNIILIFDEVFTGWSKTGKLFYFFHFDNNIIPDILTFSKSFGGGKSSISGFVSKDKIFNKAYNSVSEFNLHSTTYNSFGEECITAIEALNIIIEEGYSKKAENIEKIIKPLLKNIQKKYPKIIKDIRGVGALHGFTINSSELIINKLTNLLPIQKLKNSRFVEKICHAAIIKKLYEEHRILAAFTTNHEICFWISPSLIATQKEINYFFNSLDLTLNLGLNKLVYELINSKISQLFKK